jgi:hypothetical protein
MEHHCSENELERERDAGALLERNAHIPAAEVVVEEVAAAGGGQSDVSVSGSLLLEHEVDKKACGVAGCNSC